MKAAFLLAAWAGLFLAGCATSTPEKRKQEKYGAYAELAPNMRALVDQGKIAIGMPMDAVYIAWGKPSDVVGGESAEGPLVTWIYHGTYLQEQHYWSYRNYGRYRRYHYSGPYLETDYTPQGYIRGEVIFVNGIVKQWRTLPAPP